MLLRCLESGGFVLDDGQPLTMADLAARVRRPSTGDVAPADLHLLLPALRCLVTTLPVAKHEARLFTKTLPWTLEERLLEPVEQLHFAHGAPAEGIAPVTAINTAWLQNLLARLHAAGLQPEFAYSELFLVPWQRGQWTVFIPANDAPVLVRHGAHAGFACARANLNAALQLLLNESNEAPRQFVVIAEPSTHLDDGALFPVLLQSQLVLQRRSAEQLSGAVVLPPCNMLQGRFAPALPWAQWWRQWRLAAALLAGLLVTDLALSAYDSVRWNSEADRNEAALVELYRSVQPDGELVDPQLQLEQALVAVGAAAQPGFLTLLSRMAPALQTAPGTRVQNLEYDSTSGYLQVQVLTADYAAAENLRARLQQLGLQADLLGSNRESDGSHTRLRVGG